MTADENPFGTRTAEPSEDLGAAEEHEDLETAEDVETEQSENDELEQYELEQHEDDAPHGESETAEQDAAAEDDDVAASFGPAGSFSAADDTGPAGEFDTADDLEAHEDFAAARDYETTEDVEVPADAGPTSESAPLGYAAPVPDQELPARLREIQLGFVDDPRRAALNAQELLVEVLQSLTEGCAREREGLRGSVAETAPDTERMRLVVQRARTLIDAVSGADRPDGAPAAL